MMKHYILLLLFFSLLTNAQIVNIPDANFKAKLLTSSPTANIAKNCIGQYIKIDANNDAEIQESEAALVCVLRVHGAGIQDMTGIEAFTNLRSLTCTNNNIATLDVSMLPLEALICYNNQLTSLNVSGMSTLTNLSCNTNQLASLNTSGLTSLAQLDCSYNAFTALNLTGITALQGVNCSNNDIITFEIPNLPLLTSVDCSSNNLSSITIPNLPLLRNVNCNANQITAITNMSPNLYYLYCNNNLLTSLNLSQATALRALSCAGNDISDLNVQGLVSLSGITCSDNELYSINLTGLSDLHDLNCTGNHITSLAFPDSPMLNTLYCDHNNLTTLDLTLNEEMLFLTCSYNSLTSLIVSDNYLNELNCDHNLLTAVPYADTLRCSFNQLTSLNLGAGPIDQLICTDNPLTSLIVNCTDDLDCSNNMLTSLTLLSDCWYVDASDNQLESFTLTTEVGTLKLNNNDLHTLFIKNGTTTDSLYLNQNPNLAYICADNEEFDYVSFALEQAGNTTCEVNSYCTYTPGVFYDITGQQRLDADNNGCNTSDALYPNLKFDITNGTVNGTIVSDESGNYSIPVQAGTHTITPLVENPQYYDITPAVASITFPGSAAAVVQHFCIAPNGAHPDVEITLFNTSTAVPGFDCNYSIMYKNKGTTTASGTVNLSFDDTTLDFVAANPVTDSQSTGILSWNYTNLQPFESRLIGFTLNLNSPVETPPLNQDDILVFTANISLASDEMPANNTAVLNQTVFNAVDPNDKTCLEGATITPQMVGEYVHYKIRFENTGNYPAAIVTVKDVIDTSKFDISTLTPITASHPFITRITNSNQVEFVFNNIMLPFDDANNDGYVVFKIKTKPTLVLGDQLTNTAGIYFNYNAPVITNTAVTTVAIPLGIDENENKFGFALYPNPAKDVLNISSKTNANIDSVVIYNTLGQEVMKVLPAVGERAIDVSKLSGGHYIIKVISETVSWASQFIKD